VVKVITNIFSGIAEGLSCHYCLVAARRLTDGRLGLPQRLPMSDINLATAAADTPPNEIPIPIDDVETTPASKPEFISETLYIQNLNEKIRIDGSTPVTVSLRVLTIFPSPQIIIARSFQVVR
jgi:hypothetical protein